LPEQYYYQQQLREPLGRAKEDDVAAIVVLEELSTCT